MVVPAFNEIRKRVESKGRRVAIEMSDSNAMLVCSFRAALELEYTIELAQEPGETPIVRTEFIDQATGRRVSSPPEVLGDYNRGSGIPPDHVVEDFFRHYSEITIRR